MTIKRSTATANALLAAGGTTLADQFELAFIYIFSGAVPDSADDALDMVATHTELCKVGNGGSSTGITWGTPANGILPKAAAEDWEGTNAFEGFDEATSPLAQQFFRICAAGDNGRAAAHATTGFRIQGTAGGPGSGADMILPAATMVDAAECVLGDGSLNLQPLDEA